MVRGLVFRFIHLIHPLSQGEKVGGEHYCEGAEFPKRMALRWIKNICRKLHYDRLRKSSAKSSRVASDNPAQAHQKRKIVARGLLNKKSGTEVSLFLCWGDEVVEVLVFHF